ncbi:RNase adapter RapZ [Pontixanthobacter gangjinensis]|uniref:RNase adapter RapZ n=1 Tax=Pontixanthobacter gangjinensis TaxID=1028742 RepID=A0A6I4SLB0_9SPHN|nr:RNase adapter RapZ [Pontixanthobacter gangjinensis]MXO56493.1 RNase adapter RapZ [Pontixanthobacter gangjinensis]
MIDDSRPSSPPAMQRILLVTGLSGAGKTTALRVLEDMGWEAIDNFPIRLLGGLIDHADRDGQSSPLAIGFDSRTRGFVPHDIITKVKQLAARSDLQITTLFLDCASSELERRYNETRRRHPMAHERPVHVGIQAERELLEPLRRWADAVIDTSAFASNQLQQSIREQFSGTAPQSMSVIISSFGFARGTPPLADLVFDMRFLDNPHWIDELREQTGLDDPVGVHIKQDPAFDKAFDQIRDLLLTLLPRYAAQGKSYVNIAFGCTGGRHRSVFTAALMANSLHEHGFSPTVLHRNLGSRAADEIEGLKA